MLSTYRFILIFSIILVVFSACTSSNELELNVVNEPHPDITHDAHASIIVDPPSSPNDYIDFTDSVLDKIYFAGGCFWGVEAYFERIYGVYDVTAGYANGIGTDPTYQVVMSGEEEFVEAVEVIFDSERVSVEELLVYFFKVIDPTILNQQGNDVGIQYRTGIYYVESEDLDKIEAAVKEEQKMYTKDIVTEVLPLENFYLAEDYHQDYLAKNPNGYCHINLNILNEVIVDAHAYKLPSELEIQEILTSKQYEITMENGTEEPFNNAYWDHNEPGIYVDVVTGEPLFTSSAKYNSDSGWPSFYEPISEEVVTYHEDTSHQMVRMEVRSRVGDIHLGHVFDNGPEEYGGREFCINSAALKFIHLDNMKENGYRHLVNLIR